MRQSQHDEILRRQAEAEEHVSARLARGEERFWHIEEKLDRVLAAMESIDQIKKDLADVKDDAAKTKEILEAWGAVKTAGKFLKWVAGIIAAIAAIIVAFKAGYNHMMR